jgi:hypothetical protein
MELPAGELISRIWRWWKGLRPGRTGKMIEAKPLSRTRRRRVQEKLDAIVAEVLLAHAQGKRSAREPKVRANGLLGDQ